MRGYGGDLSKDGLCFFNVFFMVVIRKCVTVYTFLQFIKENKRSFHLMTRYVILLSTVVKASTGSETLNIYIRFSVHAVKAAASEMVIFSIFFI